MIDPAEFRQRLAETIAWCLRPAASLEHYRSPRLNPVYDLLTAHHTGDPVTTVTEERSRHFNNWGMGPQPPATHLHGGRLVLFAPDDSLSDGAANVASDGYFDDHNLPAWDSWIAFDTVAPLTFGECWGSPSRSLIVSWVPPTLFDRVGDGISVNPESCIGWADSRVDAYYDPDQHHTYVEAYVRAMAYLGVDP